MCENNNFTPCLRAFSQFPLWWNNTSERENFVFPGACFCMMGVLYSHKQTLEVHKGKHASWLVHTFGHFSGTLSIQYAMKGEAKVPVLAGKKTKKILHCRNNSVKCRI